MSQEGLLIMKKSKPKKSKKELKKLLTEGHYHNGLFVPGPKKEPWTEKEKDKARKKYHACEHDKVGYMDLVKLSRLGTDRSCQDADNIFRLTKTNYELGAIIEQLRQDKVHNKKTVEAIIDRYENDMVELEKSNKSYVEANTQLTLNVNELKERLFGKFEMRLKNLALRPTKKKDN